MPISRPIKKIVSPTISKMPPTKKRSNKSKPSGEAVTPSMSTIAITGKTEEAVSLNFFAISMCYPKLYNTAYRIFHFVATTPPAANGNLLKTLQQHCALSQCLIVHFFEVTIAFTNILHEFRVSFSRVILRCTEDSCFPALP